MDEQLSAHEAKLKESVNIAVIGKVSCGKSSLLNAFFKKQKGDELHFEVGATSGITTEAKIVSPTKGINIIDLPGLDDIKSQNSQEAKNFLDHIDIGILVVTGSADASQKSHYDNLKLYCDKVFVVMNKVDEYDRKPKALQEVLSQWREVLGLSSDEKIYQTCCDGYDPNDEAETLNVKGVDEFRDDVMKYAETTGKDLVLKRALESKSSLAQKVILGALAGVATSAFIPGSTIYITGIQATAIMSIHYIYTDEILSKKSAIAAVPLFASQSIGSNLFIFAKSFLPPTGVVDVAAAGVAVTVTLAMLSTVNWIYKNGWNIDSLENKAEIKEQYKTFFNLLKKMDTKEIFAIISSKDKKKILDLIAKFVS